MKNILVDLKGLSAPITKLVEVTAKGMGNAYAPFGTFRQAKADAKAKIIHAEADKKVLSIEQRTDNRLIIKEESRQENLENIAVQAKLELPEKVSDKKLDDDWVAQFFEHAQDVHDGDMQKLWARILAGEIASPETYSKRTLQFLKTLDKWEAEKFSELCSFVTKDKGGWNIIFDLALSEKIRSKLGQKDYINHFCNIGLTDGTERVVDPSKITGTEIHYFDQKYIFKGPAKVEKDPNSKVPFITPFEIPIQVKYFTSIGQQLANIADPLPIDNMITGLEKALNTKSQISSISIHKV